MRHRIRQRRKGLKTNTRRAALFVILGVLASMLFGLTWFFLVRLPQIRQHEQRHRLERLRGLVLLLVTIVGGCCAASLNGLEIVVPDHLAEQVIDAIARNAHTGLPSDGLIFVSPVDDVIKIRTDERGHEH